MMARTRKEKPDPICEACRERMKGNVPAHACEWCREEQQQKGRRAWVTDIKLGSVLLGDMNEIGQRVPADSVDVIFTDPVYLKEHYQQAYADLAELALRVLKPHGFLFTYAPQTHLDEIMDMLRFTGTWRHGGKLQYFWVIESLNGGQSTAKNHQRNAICLHKPILVFQKAPEGVQLKGARRCFADVVRGYRQKRFHPWQQSVHDVLGIIDRFMQPGEILLDPYAGTGTSLIAGQLLGMDVVGFEIDPNTHAIAVREMQQKPLGLIDEDLSPDTEREPAPELKETSRQAGIESPAKEARPVELKAACLRCKVSETCTTHAPYVNCKKIEAGKADTSKQLPEAIPPSNEATVQPTRQDPDHGPQPISTDCRECERFEQCTSHDPHAGCLDAVKAIEKAPAPSGGPTLGTCGTCGHHKGRKTFHETCPRLGELLFKGGTKSAKVLMEETQRERCEHWIDKMYRPEPNKGKTPSEVHEECLEKNLILMRLKRDSPEWFAALTAIKRGNCPGWHWEVWKHDPKKNAEWLFEGARTEEEANEIKSRLESDDVQKGCTFDVRKRPPDANPREEMVCANGGVCGDEKKIRKVQETAEITNLPKENLTCGSCTTPKKKSTAKKPKPYTIYIKRSDGAHPFVVSCDSRGYGGASNPCDTKEEVIKRALVTLGDFVYHVKKPSPTLAKKPLPVTIETTLFIDKTGLFTPADFFDAEGVPKKPIVEPKKKTRKKTEAP
jgi:site-specific DNA-methyltransferase (adenine-specific)